jgi:hypothetical protein
VAIRPKKSDRFRAELSLLVWSGLGPRTPAAPQLARYSAELRCPIRGWNRCGCQTEGPRTFRPMRTWLNEQTSPEMLYLETKWASLIPFARATDLLKEVLPVGDLVTKPQVRIEHCAVFRLEFREKTTVPLIVSSSTS